MVVLESAHAHAELAADPLPSPPPNGKGRKKGRSPTELADDNATAFPPLFIITAVLNGAICCLGEVLMKVKA